MLRSTSPQLTLSMGVSTGWSRPAGIVLIVRATKKLRQRLGAATPHDGEPSTTLLGDWYATLLPWTT